MLLLYVPTPLARCARLAVNGHSLERPRIRPGNGRESDLEGGRQGIAVELGEEPLQGRLAGRVAGGKAGRREEDRVLIRPPFGDRQHGAAVGEESGDGQGEDGRERVDDTGRPAWIGEGGEG